MLRISSAANPKFKQLIALQKPRERKREGLCLVEGRKELEMAVAGGLKLLQLFFSPDIISEKELRDLLKGQSPEVMELEQVLFEKLSYRESTGGIIAIAKPEPLALQDLKLNKTPLVLVLESIEKPGNLGAIIRTADAANVDAVIVCDPLSDIYNPNVIRSSLGTVFTKQVVTTTSEEAMAFLKSKGISILCTYLESAEFYQHTDFTKASAIVMGTEATGLTDKWLKVADQNIKIPMLGHIDCMNVSVAAAIVTFEAKRQRGFN